MAELMIDQDDFLRIHTEYFGSLTLRINKLGLSWPPPQFVVMDGSDIRQATDKDDRANIFERVSMSQITDDQIRNMTHVARGAEYKYVEREVF